MRAENFQAAAKLVEERNQISKYIVALNDDPIDVRCGNFDFKLTAAAEAVLRRTFMDEQVAALAEVDTKLTALGMVF